MTFEYAITDKPPICRRGRPGTNWKQLAEKMADVAPKAVFVKANGVTPRQIRNNARRSLDYYFRGSGFVHSKLDKNGIYFWLDEKVLKQV